MIYIQKKNINECSGIEKFVKDMMNKRDISFFPIEKAIALEEK